MLELGSFMVHSEFQRTRVFGQIAGCPDPSSKYLGIYPEYSGYESDIRTHVRSIRAKARSIRALANKSYQRFGVIVLPTLIMLMCYQL